MCCWEYRGEFFAIFWRVCRWLFVLNTYIYIFIFFFNYYLVKNNFFPKKKKERNNLIWKAIIINRSPWTSNVQRELFNTIIELFLLVILQIYVKKLRRISLTRYIIIIVETRWRKIVVFYFPSFRKDVPNVHSGGGGETSDFVAYVEKSFDKSTFVFII